VDRRIGMCLSALKSANMGEPRKTTDGLTALVESEEWNLVQDMVTFELSLGIFSMNFRELERALRYHSDFEGNIELFTMRASYKMRALMREVLRLLHNFVASAQSLIDHTRVIYRARCEPRKLLSEYRTQVNKRFVEDGLCSFIVGLRQFCQHYRIPAICSRLSFAGEHATSSMVLATQDLLRFSSWRRPAKEFLEGSGDAVDIDWVARAYHDKVLGFYRWFMFELRIAHREEIAALESRQRSLRRELMPDIAAWVRMNWESSDTRTLRSLEEGFVGVFSEDDWRRLDAAPPEPEERARLIIRMLQEKGVSQPDFETEIRERFHSVLNS
jgi:hypothetical protein